jgi:hypothetical protein
LACILFCSPGTHEALRSAPQSFWPSPPGQLALLDSQTAPGSGPGADPNSDVPNPSQERRWPAGGETFLLGGGRQQHGCSESSGAHSRYSPSSFHLFEIVFELSSSGLLILDRRTSEEVDVGDFVRAGGETMMFPISSLVSALAASYSTPSPLRVVSPLSSLRWRRAGSPLASARAVISLP